MLRKMLVVMCGVALALSVVGCKSTPPAAPPTPGTPEGRAITEAPPSSEPLWVSAPGKAFPDRAKDTFFGVGVGEAKRLPGIYLRRRAAIDRARNEIAGQLEVFVASVFKDYTEAAFTPSMDVAESQSLTSNVQKSVVAATLTGVKTEEVWKDPTTQDYYALVALDFNSVAQQLKDKIQEVEKGKLSVAAEKAHDELDKIIMQKKATINP